MGIYIDEAGRDIATQRCTSCKRDLPLEFFTTRKSSPTGYRYQCRACRAEVSKPTRRARHAATLVMERECKTCGCKLIRDNKPVNGRLRTYCDYCRKLRQRCRRVGIMREQFWQLYHQQKGLCFLCQVNPIETLDHNHDTGKFRGLLCQGCNLLVGWVEIQGLEVLRKLEEYLASDLS